MMADHLRRAELAKIHVGKKELALSDENYRAMLRNVAGVESSADLDLRGRGRVIEHMEKLGAFKTASKTAPKAGRLHNAGEKRELTKVNALLADAKLPVEYGDAIAKRMYSVERLEFCTSEQLRGVITALVKKSQRDAAKEA